MRQSLARIAGLALVAGALLGLLLSLAGLVGLAVIFPQAQQAATRELVSLDQALATTGDGLLLASVSLGEAEVAISSLRTTILSSGQAITDTLPTLATITTLTEADFPRTVRSIQAALASARETAAVADSVLGAISGLPFIGSAIYNPEVPLNVAIGEVSASLDPLPASLGEVAQGLRVADTNLRQIGSDLDQLAEEVSAIGTSMSATGQVLTSYQSIINDLRSRLDQLRAALPIWIGLGGLGLFLLLIWFAIAQISLLMQGLALLRRL
jgi:hypothetical protein